MDVMGLQEISVAATAVHDFVGKFSLQLADRFLDDAGEPLDAVERFGFARQARASDTVFGWDSVLDVQVVVAADLLDGLSDLVGGHPFEGLVFSVVEEILNAPAVFVDKCELVCVEPSALVHLAGLVELHGLDVELLESVLV